MPLGDLLYPSFYFILTDGTMRYKTRLANILRRNCDPERTVGRGRTDDHTDGHVPSVHSRGNSPCNSQAVVHIAPALVRLSAARRLGKVPIVMIRIVGKAPVVMLVPDVSVIIVPVLVPRVVMTVFNFGIAIVERIKA